uniref:CCHC-type domain-containing protein n=1 Tax=Bracon brevicornis TaxID=1563983 RepID=A0A6V7IHH1_9HYME
MEESGDVKEHLGSFFDTVEKLRQMDMNLDEEMLTIILLYSLPSNFENFRCAIESRDELPTSENLRIKIIEEYEIRKNDGRHAAPDALIAEKYVNKYKKSQQKQNHNSQQLKMKKLICHRCNKEGHKAKNCTENISKKAEANNTEQMSLNASFDSIQTHEAFNAMAVREREKWCIDSGATTHLCKNERILKKVTDTRRGKLYLPSHDSTDITGRGTVEFTSEEGGELKNVTLQDVSCVPDLRMNLLSVAKLTDKGLNVNFDEKSAVIIHRSTKHVVLTGKRVNDLYFLNENSQQCNATDLNEDTLELTETEIWHLKMGHLNVRDLRESSQKNNIRGVKLERFLKRI